MGTISFYLEDVKPVKVGKRRLKVFLCSLLDIEGFEHEIVSVIFCSDEYLLKINQAYLKHDYLTDIITFDYSQNRKISGELFISTDRVRDNAIKYKVDFHNEILRVIIHGFLHLAGYTDKTAEDKKRMKEKEDYYLEKFLTNN